MREVNYRRKGDYGGQARQFARNFRTYSAQAIVQRKTAEALISSLVSVSPRRRWGKVLELGCGTGLLTRAFREELSCDELHLFDLAANCPAFLTDVTYDSFTVSDFDELERLQPADLILSGSCFQWLRDPARLFRVIYAALPSGGIFAASTFAEGNLAELASCGGRPLVCPSATTWRGWLEACGFVVRQFTEGRETLWFESPLDVLRHLKRTGVLIPVSEGYRDVGCFLSRYEALRKDGKIPLTYAPVYWIAEKQ